MEFQSALLFFAIFQEFAGILDMQRVTNANRLVKRHILNGIDTILIRGNTLLCNANLVG